MKQPKCRDCGQSIVWFNLQGYGPRPFEPKPVDPTDARLSFPVWNGTTAWRLGDLIEQLQVQRECSSTEAYEEACAMPFYVRHTCPNAPDRDAPTRQEAAV